MYNIVRSQLNPSQPFGHGTNAVDIRNYNMASKALLKLLPKSSSAKSLNMSIENKRGLSSELDKILKEGVHDMR